MPRLRLKQCVACRHYMIEGISTRCTLETNTYQNWMGTCYKVHPSQTNMRGDCKDYEEIDKSNTTG